MQIMRLILICLILSLTGCYAHITGKVVDAETGKPIEGAIILVEWTKTKGLPGLTHTESYRVIEVTTDKEGKATISGLFSLTANYPYVTVYKKGYVAWNNEFIFPNYEERKDFKWVNGYVFRLEKFRTVYTHDDHTSFIHTAIRLGIGEKNLMLKAINWEEKIAVDERQRGGK